MENFIESEESYIVVLKSDFSVEYINDVFLRKYPCLKLYKNFFSNFLSIQEDEFAVSLQSAVENVKKTKKISDFSIKVLNKDNKYKYYLAKVIPLFNNAFKLDKFLLFCKDITDKIVGKSRRLKKLPILIGKDIGFVDVRDIYYIKADNIYSKIYCFESDHLCPIPIGKLEELLPREVFIRTHKSYIINIDCINRLKRNENTYHLLIRNKKIVTIPISRRKSKEILDILGLK
jgi:two-component system LytT family response regulator